MIMTLHEFNLLSKRYLNGETTPEEDELLKQWYEKQSGALNTKLDETQKEEINHRIWGNIKKEIRPTSKIVKMRLLWISGLAACLLLGLGLWWFMRADNVSFPTNLAKNEENRGMEMKNTTNTEQKITLNDGTTVLLKPNSSLFYGKNFNKSKREVFLEGEGFFEVTHDTNRPFIVHAGQLVTEVLGTSFRIAQNPLVKSVEVSVTTGKVSVYAVKQDKKTEKNGVILTRNQKVIYDTKQQNIITDIVENPTPKAENLAKNPVLVFEMTPLESVLKKLSDLYGIEFVITNPTIKTCLITADLSDLSMFTQLELICKSIEAHYEKRGSVIFIDGEGCE